MQEEPHLRHSRVLESLERTCSCSCLYCSCRFHHFYKVRWRIHRRLMKEEEHKIPRPKCQIHRTGVAPQGTLSPIKFGTNFCTPNFSWSGNKTEIDISTAEKNNHSIRSASAVDASEKSGWCTVFKACYMTMIFVWSKAWGPLNARGPRSVPSGSIGYVRPANTSSDHCYIASSIQG